MNERSKAEILKFGLNKTVDQFSALCGIQCHQCLLWSHRMTERTKHFRFLIFFLRHRLINNRKNGMVCHSICNVIENGSGPVFLCERVLAKLLVNLNFCFFFLLLFLSVTQNKTFENATIVECWCVMMRILKVQRNCQTDRRWSQRVRNR